MFIETDENINLFNTNKILPCILRTMNSYYKQENKKRPVSNNYHKFLWCVEGEGILQIDNHNFILSPGKGFFSKEETTHFYYSEDGNFFTAWFTFNGLDKLFEHFNIGKYFIFDVPSYLNSYIKEIEHNISNSTIFDRSAELYALIIKLFSSLLTDNIPFNQQIDNYLENNFSKDISLESIAEYIGISKYRLCHKYAENSSKTIMETLKQIRISKSKQLLTTTDYPIHEISAMCGFTSPSYFGANFKKEVKSTPKEFRVLMNQQLL